MSAINLRKECDFKRVVKGSLHSSRGGSRGRVRGCAHLPPRDEAFFIFALKFVDLTSQLRHSLVVTVLNVTPGGYIADSGL